MITSFFSDILGVGNASRQQTQQRRIIKFLSKSQKSHTIPEISKHVKISVPTTTKLIIGLMEDNWIVESGKKENEKGRKPVLYSINKDKFYTIGVEIILERIQFCIVRIDSKVVFEKTDNNFTLSNTEESLQEVIHFIKTAINDSCLNINQVIGIGVGITGRVNKITGESLNYFNFIDKGLKLYLEDKLDVFVILDNDTRVLGIAEQVMGNARGNELILNISRGLGMTVIINDRVVYGSSGFAGEFGHMQFGVLNRLCLCGKKGCLGTEVSGYALEEDLKDALLGDESSIYFKAEDMEQYDHNDIINAALKGDGLALQLIQLQGVKLGEALGNILNLLNPELIVIGGEMARLGDAFVDSIKMGIKKTGLVNLLPLCSISISNIGFEAGSKGAASMIWKKYRLI